MRKMVRFAAAVLLCAVMPGCATYVTRISDGREGYPLAAQGCYEAVRGDAFVWCMCCVPGSDNRWFAADYSVPFQWLATPVVTACVLPDLLVSAVFDTVFCPWDWWANREGVTQ